MAKIIKTISIDLETQNLINERKRDDPTFNFSEFIRESVLNGSTKSTTIPIEMIEKNLREAELKIQMARDNKEHWETAHKNYLVRLEMEKAREKEVEEEIRLKKEKEEQKQNMIKSTFLEEMKREMTDFELEEYLKHGKNIWAFCDEIKERENKDVII